jgi:cyclopropane fatty-acyl-phospholipid synthase-like methyltransferase
MLWIHAVTEGRGTVLMNPTSWDKMRSLARFIDLGAGHHVLDIGAGRCGPALLFAEEFGCRVTAVEPYGDFLDEARERVGEAGLTDRFEFVQTSGADFAIEPGRYDVAMCLGATWAWGGLEGTLDALAAAVRPDGHVVAGEPFRHAASDPIEDHAHNFLLPEVVECFEQRGLAVTTLIRSSTDDWDDYTSVRAKNLLDWLAGNPGHDELDTVKQWRRDETRRLAQPYIGWAMVAGRRTLDE